MMVMRFLLARESGSDTFLALAILRVLRDMISSPLVLQDRGCVLFGITIHPILSFSIAHHFSIMRGEDCKIEFILNFSFNNC